MTLSEVDNIVDRHYRRRRYVFAGRFSKTNSKERQSTLVSGPTQTGLTACRPRARGPTARSVAFTASAAIRRLGRPVFEIVQHLLFAHIAVADQQELQQVIVFLLLRTTVGFKRHANSGSVKSLATRRSAVDAGRLCAARTRSTGMRPKTRTPPLSAGKAAKHHGRERQKSFVVHSRTYTRTRAHSSSVRRGYGPLRKVLTRLITLIDPCDQLLLLLLLCVPLLLLPLLFLVPPPPPHQRRCETRRRQR